MLLSANADSRLRIEGLPQLAWRAGQASAEPEIRLVLVFLVRNSAKPNHRGHTVDLAAPHVWQSRHLRAYDARQTGDFATPAFAGFAFFRLEAMARLYRCHILCQHRRFDPGQALLLSRPLPLIRSRRVSHLVHGGRMYATGSRGPPLSCQQPLAVPPCYRPLQARDTTNERDRMGGWQLALSHDQSARELRCA